MRVTSLRRAPTARSVPNSRWRSARFEKSVLASASPATAMATHVRAVIIPTMPFMPRLRSADNSRLEVITSRMESPHRSAMACRTSSSRPGSVLSTTAVTVSSSQ